MQARVSISVLSVAATAALVAATAGGEVEGASIDVGVHEAPFLESDLEAMQAAAASEFGWSDRSTSLRELVVQGALAQYGERVGLNRHPAVRATTTRALVESEAATAVADMPKAEIDFDLIDARWAEFVRQADSATGTQPSLNDLALGRVQDRPVVGAALISALSEMSHPARAALGDSRRRRGWLRGIFEREARRASAVEAQGLQRGAVRRARRQILAELARAHISRQSSSEKGPCTSAALPHLGSERRRLGFVGYATAAEARVVIASAQDKATFAWSSGVRPRVSSLMTERARADEWPLVPAAVRRAGFAIRAVNEVFAEPVAAGGQFYVVRLRALAAETTRLDDEEHRHAQFVRDRECRAISKYESIFASVGIEWDAR